MNIKKVNVNITENDVNKMIELICTEKQSLEKTNDIVNLFTELLLNNTSASSLFVQIMIGNGLPERFQEDEIVKCHWKRISIGLSNKEDIYQKLTENDLLNVDDEVICKIDSFRGYTEYFPYTVKFKYGHNLYETASIGFEDIIF